MQKTRLKVENARLHITRQKKPLMQDDIRTGILNRTISSAISDTGGTSTAGKGGHPFRVSNHPSDKVFHLPTRGTARASVKAKLMHKLI